MEMETHPSRGGLRVSIAWSGAGGSQRRSLSLSGIEVWRAALVLGLCAVSFALGLSWRRPSAPTAASAPQIAPAAEIAALPAAEPGAASAPGHPYGQQAELITPLNVRDPASLVMPPPN